MLQIVPQLKIYVACEPVDFRKGISGLAGYCQSVLGHDPYSGALFLFRNKRRTALKILVYDGQGLWLCHKKLCEGTWTWWPTSEDRDLSKGSFTQLLARELSILIWNGDPRQTKWGADWRPIDFPEPTARPLPVL